MKTYKIRNKADGGILEITEDQLAAYGLEVPNQMAKGGMIKRADGSYSRPGLWDNIRKNKGSGKKPTKAMLAQEKKIRAAEKAYGGYMDMGGYMNPYMGYGGMYDMGGMYPMGGYVPMDMMAQGGINNPGFRALPDYVQEKIKDNMAYGGCKECGGKMQNGGTPLQQYLQKYPYRPATDTIPLRVNRMARNNYEQYPNTDGYQRDFDTGKVIRSEQEEKRIKDLFDAFGKKYKNADEYREDAVKYSISPSIPGDYPVPIMKTGGKLPKEVLRARLESHMSPGQAQNYLSAYGMGGYLEEAGDGKWIQKATASIKRRGTEGVCTGSKFGGPGCPPGSKRYNLAKTFRKMAKSKKEEGGYAQGGEYEMTDAEIAKLRSMGYKVKEV
jgi:hypothetical protein